MRNLRCKTRWVIYILYLIIICAIIRQILLVRQNKTDNHEEETSIPSTTDIYKAKNDKYEQLILNYMKGIIHGLGEYGKPAYLTGRSKMKGKESLKKKAINIVLSNKISLQRKLPDVRDPLCKNVTYDTSLPSTSVIIIFHNEAFSVLLRTVYSVLKRTPSKLLKEIILVDDKSNEEELLGLLDYYIETRLPKKVKLIRLKERQGLVRARLKGAKSATGEVLMFLDAHCEVIQQWLEPLLQRIKEKPNAVVTPIIDNISEETFEYSHNDEPSFFQVGGFTWSGHFTWINIQDVDLKLKSSPISPVRSPTMAGGLFAISRRYFWEIGSYDDKMEGWGGENLEMSFRIWQCGGILETIPCSRVGHVFRNFLPYKFPFDKDTHGINTARLANVWMDDYKRLYYLHREEYKDKLKLIGDTKDRVKLRERLKCKSFKWYLDNIYPEKFIPDENVQAFGKVKVQSKNLCLDNLQRDEEKPYNLGVYECHAELFPSQYFSMSKNGELRREDTCATVVEHAKLKDVFKVNMKACDEIDDDKEWTLTEDGKIIHLRTGLCLDASGLNSKDDVLASTCSDSSAQFWSFEFYGDRINPR
ncbi:polypeptide N-acetylgalactosaminyltransferase 1-like [Trichogramma pretiosum]|uniref:polypeptide N-acetylgalactosaminyltransferase 1-like n=1 Tax=Trichogramma pretiosum TaxID=7493 RepID=UPI0006C9C6EC|nr:polypeptide N-acetylgalactosaminyltransferase 1-like [Trichogramma pretiosum]